MQMRREAKCRKPVGFTRARPFLTIARRRDTHGYVPAAELERRLECFDDSCAIVGREREPILDDLDADLAARMDSRVAVAREKPLDLGAAEILGHRYRERHEHACARSADARLTRELGVDRFGIV